MTGASPTAGQPTVHLGLPYHARHTPDHPAVAMADGSLVISYRELADEAAWFAQLFRSLGLEVGDHVAFCVENTPRYVSLMWGAHLAGLYYTACSTRLRGAELAYIIDDCGAQAVVVSQAFADHAVEIIAATPNVRHRFSFGGQIDGHDPVEKAFSLAPMPIDDSTPVGRDMLYSSGTTGRPKGIRPPLLNSQAGDPMLVVPMLTGILDAHDGEAVLLSPAPLYHSAPLRYIMSMTQIGGTVVLMPKFDAEAALKAISNWKVTHALMVPTMFVRLLKLDPERRTSADISSLRAAMHGGGPCPISVKMAMLEWWGPIIHEYFGATEATGMTWATPQEYLAHPGTVGRAILGKVRVLAEDGRTLEAHQTGTVYFGDGPQFEYHNDPDRTAQAHSTEGWSTYGDIGHLDEDGFLHLTDRSEFVVVSGGVNIYPQEAENVLLGLPQVLDAAVFGVPDDEYGEVLHAAVQPVTMPRGDAERARISEEILAGCRANLSQFKCPRTLEFLEELPRHDTGKLYKRLLQDRSGHTASTKDR